MLDKSLSPRTIQYAIQTVKHMFNVAIKQGFFKGENPTRGIKIPKKDNKRIRFLTRDEAKMLLQELKKHSQDTYEIAYLSLYTGMRFSEIANLTSRYRF
ncbi:tyrosine-type recombinase/integrase [Hippea alviniae]|uniref:tyrosine-type recombinase/integrase n=1 Tax=Hippea alviniae TaxID=1279027 RepID=UPI000479C083|nr:hypothetical protein [Hippea alviniae]